MREAATPACAKINLTLRVGARRPDGYHEIESLVARVGLCDTVRVRLRHDARFTIACDDDDVPSDESNLALRAAAALADAAGIRSRGVHIELHKRIPAGAGLGGGSADAAAVLRTLNDLWGARLSRETLLQIAAGIGSDAPLFLHGPLCVIRGRGEQVIELPRPLAGWAVLVLPDIRCSTRDVYAAFDRLRPEARPSAEEVLGRADSCAALMPHLFNDLEPAAFDLYPALARLAEQTSKLAGGAVRMSGSGSCLYRLQDGESDARAFAQAVTARLGTRVETVVIGASA